MGRKRDLAASFVLLGLLAGTAPCQRTVAPIDQPQFLQVELLEVTPVGFCGALPFYSGNYYVGLRTLKLTYHSGSGFRAGISLADGSGPTDFDMGDYPSASSYAPVHVGYDIVFNPKKTAFFYGMVPSCYVEATLGALPLYAKVAVACDIDYYGLGVGAEAGCLTWNNSNPPYLPPPAAFRPAFYASVKLHLLDAAFRLPGRR